MANIKNLREKIYALSISLPTTIIFMVVYGLKQPAEVSSLNSYGFVVLMWFFWLSLFALTYRFICSVNKTRGVEVDY